MYDSAREVWRPATQSEACHEYVANHARALAERGEVPAWILSPFDTWHRNPLYSGPPVPHPEDYPHD